jgi:RNA polymerase sigma-70 factor (ECF subfamily)
MKSEQWTDEQLMLAFARGEVPAFDELFRRYWEKLRGFFMRRQEDRSRAEELAQDTFLIVSRAASRYEQRALFRTYLYAIAFRVLRAERRRARLRALLFLPAGEKELAGGSADEKSVWIRQALGRLGRNEREVLLLREYEQLSYAEIGELLELPLNTVRSRLFRAREALREILLSERHEPLRAEVTAGEERA